MNPRSQKAAEFAAEFVYGLQYDYVIKQAVRHQQTLEEVLEHANIDKMWRMIITPGDAPVATEHVEAELSKSAVSASLIPAESLSQLQQPERASHLETVESAAEVARKQVRSQIQTVDGSMSLQKLAKLLKATEITNKLRGTADSSILVVYVVDAAGERERDARRSPTPARKEHMEKVIQAVLASRGESLPDFDGDKTVYPALDPSDV